MMAEHAICPHIAIEIIGKLEHDQINVIGEGLAQALKSMGIEFGYERS